jgi:hypothetical protein
MSAIFFWKTLLAKNTHDGSQAILAKALKWLEITGRAGEMVVWSARNQDVRMFDTRFAGDAHQKRSMEYVSRNSRNASFGLSDQKHPRQSAGQSYSKSFSGEYEGRNDCRLPQHD